MVYFLHPKIGNERVTSKMLVERSSCMSRKVNANSKKVVCLTREEEALFELVKEVTNYGKLHLDNSDVCKNESLVNRLGICLELCKNKIISEANDLVKVGVIKAFNDAFILLAKEIEEMRIKENRSEVECKMLYYAFQLPLIKDIYSSMNEKDLDVSGFIMLTYIFMKEFDLFI